MAEEIEKLLDRIRKEGVDKANAESEKILAEARARAAALVKEAEGKAAAVRKQAERDGALFTERGRQALRQAARDVILSIGESLNGLLAGVIAREVKGAMTADVVKRMLVSVVEAYGRSDAAGARLEVLLTPDQEGEVAQFLMSKLSAEVRKGVTVGSDRGMASGFKVTVVNDRVQHDFSGEAIAAALAQVLRPQIAELVKEALKEG